MSSIFSFPFMAPAKAITFQNKDRMTFWLMTFPITYEPGMVSVLNT